jgi:hypothetical protein
MLGESATATKEKDNQPIQQYSTYACFYWNHDVAVAV